MASTALLDLLSAAGNAFDLPGSMLRDAVSLENPLDQLLSPFSDKNRVTGRQLNRKLGLAGQDDNWGNFAGGLVTESLLDPLNMLTVAATLGVKGGVLPAIKQQLDEAAHIAGPRHNTTLDDLLVSDQVIEDAATRHANPQTAEQIIKSTLVNSGDNPYSEDTLRRVLREIPPTSELHSKLDDDSLRLLGPTHQELRQHYGMTPEVPPWAPEGERVMEMVGQPEEYRLQYGQPDSLPGVTYDPDGRIATAFEPYGTPEQIQRASQSETFNEDYFRRMKPAASVSEYAEFRDPTHHLQLPDERLLPWPRNFPEPAAVEGYQPPEEVLRDLLTESQDVHANWLEANPTPGSWTPSAPDDFSGEFQEGILANIHDPAVREGLQQIVGGENPLLEELQNLAQIPRDSFPLDESLVDQPHPGILDFLNTRRMLDTANRNLPARHLRYAPSIMNDEEAVQSMLESIGRAPLTNDAVALRRAIDAQLDEFGDPDALGSAAMEAAGSYPTDEQYWNHIDELIANNPSGDRLRDVELARARGQTLMTQDELDEFLEELQTGVLDDLSWEQLQYLDDDAWQTITRQLGEGGGLYEMQDELVENIDQHMPPGYRYASQYGGEEYASQPVLDYAAREDEGWGDEGSGALERLLTEEPRGETLQLPMRRISPQDELDELSMNPGLAEYMAMQPLDAVAPQLEQAYTMPELLDSLDPHELIREQYGRQVEAPQRLRAFFGRDHDISQARALPTEDEILTAVPSQLRNDMGVARDWLSENEPELARLLQARQDSERLAETLEPLARSQVRRPLDLDEPQPMLNELMMSSSGINSELLNRRGQLLPGVSMNAADELHPALLGVLERMGYIDQNRGLRPAFDLSQLQGDLDKLLPYLIALNTARNPLARTGEQ